jgi:hypothetical protein
LPEMRAGSAAKNCSSKRHVLVRQTNVKETRVTTVEKRHHHILTTFEERYRHENH